MRELTKCKKKYLKQSQYDEVLSVFLPKTILIYYQSHSDRVNHFPYKNSFNTLNCELPKKKFF